MAPRFRYSRYSQTIRCLESGRNARLMAPRFRQIRPDYGIKNQVYIGQTTAPTIRKTYARLRRLKSGRYRPDYGA